MKEFLSIQALGATDPLTGEYFAYKASFFSVSLNWHAQIRRNKNEEWQNWEYKMEISTMIGKLWYQDLVKAPDFKKMLSEKLIAFPSFENELELLSRFDNMDDKFSAVYYLVETGQQEEALLVIEFCKPFRKELEKYLKKEQPLF